MAVMKTEKTISVLTAEHPELYISTGSYYTPPVCVDDPGYFSTSYWTSPRIVTRDRVVLAVSLSREDKWYFPGEWQLSADWETLCVRHLHSCDAAPYLIPLKEWYAEVEKRELSGGRAITPWATLVKKKRL